MASPSMSSFSSSNPKSFTQTPSSNLKSSDSTSSCTNPTSHLYCPTSKLSSGLLSLYLLQSCHVMYFLFQSPVRLHFIEQVLIPPHKRSAMPAGTKHLTQDPLAESQFNLQQMTLSFQIPTDKKTLMTISESLISAWIATMMTTMTAASLTSVVNRSTQYPDAKLQTSHNHVKPTRLQSPSAPTTSSPRDP